MDENHEKWMKWAIAEAREAGRKNEVPVGAVIISDDQEVLAISHNMIICHWDPTGHAEMLAIRRAARKIQNYRLLNTTLYVTVEPCIMCMGAIIHSRIQRLVFGTMDEKWGAAGSLYNFAGDERLNFHPLIVGGVCEKECRELMQQFFRARRKLQYQHCQS